MLIKIDDNTKRLIDRQGNLSNLRVARISNASLLLGIFLMGWAIGFVTKVVIYPEHAIVYDRGSDAH